MYCPNCGQQQVSEEMRFCSRCGFQLGAVSALLTTGGASTNSTPTEVKSGKSLLANRRTRQGAKIMFASGVLLPVGMIFSIVFDNPGPLLLPFIVFIAGLSWLLYFRLFGEDTTTTSQTSAPAQLHAPQQSFLSASHASNIPNPTHRTAEIVQPPSVTEHTTRLLSDDK